MSLEPVAVLPLLFALILAALLAGADSRAVGSPADDLSSYAPEWALPTYKVARFAVLAFGLILAYPYIPGSESVAFKGVSLFIGVVFSLGSSSAIANLVAGSLMTSRHAFKVGDRVRIGDEVGDVSFNEYGVRIMTPAYEGDPERPKMVPREQWYAAPAAPGEHLPIQE